MLRTGKEMIREIGRFAARMPWYVGLFLAAPAYLLCGAVARTARLQLAVHDPAIIQVPLELLLALATVLQVAAPLLLLLWSLMSALHDPERQAPAPAPDASCPHCGSLGGEWSTEPCCDAAQG